MSLLSFLFRSKERRSKKPRTQGRWSISESGNPTLVEDGVRVTVFSQDGGWKYCIAKIGRDDEPFFSDAYATEIAAKEESLADLRGHPSTHQTLSEKYALSKKQKLEEQIRQRSAFIEGLERRLVDNNDLNITELRKPEAKLASHLKHFDWQMDEYSRSGIEQSLIKIAENHKPKLEELERKVRARIQLKQALRPPKKPPVSASQLTPEIARIVDALIGLFEKASPLRPEEREAKFRRAINDADANMLDNGISFNRASGGPEFLNQDESSFRAFIKEVDHDLGWQCRTVSDAFERYLKIGEMPAPHFPMRVAILLRKAKDFDREKRFLAGWCKHFPKGNGVKYGQLVERAKKAGVQLS